MSFNSLFGLGSHSEDASLKLWLPLQDNAASTAVDDVSSNNKNGTLAGGNNTSDIATTGPNSYAASALDFDGSADYVNSIGAVADFSFVQNSLVFTLCGWVRFDSASGRYAFLGTCLASAEKGFSLFYDNGAGFGTDAIRLFVTKGTVSFPVIDARSADGVINDTNWHFVSVKSTSAANAMTFTIDGTATTTTYGVSYASLSSGDSTRVLNAARANHSSVLLPLDGKMSSWSIFNRALSGTEEGEVYAGPEPINSAAPAVTGTETEGQLLSCSTGTWGIDTPFSGGSNGTITYAYQWTRSNDGAGTGEANIGSATSSTYTLTGTDVGKFIRCLVRGTNTGGFDSAADTNSNFTGAIGAAGGAVQNNLMLLGVG